MVVEDWSAAESDEIGISGVGPPECPNGHGYVTEEGLLKTSRGLEGKGGLLISSGETDAARVTSLLQTIRDLELRSQESSVLDLAHESLRKWNRKRAKRRFQRWRREHDNNLATISDEKLRRVAERLIQEEGNRVSEDFRWENEDLVRWMESGLIDAIQGYEFLRDKEPTLILANEIPEELRRAFSEARECRRWRLNEACYALCRRIVNIAIDQIEELRRDETWPSPADDRFLTRMNCFPASLLFPCEKKWITHFWKDASNFLHGREEPGNAWEGLKTIAEIIQRLAERGAFANV